MVIEETNTFASETNLVTPKSIFQISEFCTIEQDQQEIGTNVADKLSDHKVLVNTYTVVLSENRQG